MKQSEGKKILKRDLDNISFINKSTKNEINKDIEECLEKQQKEINALTRNLYDLARLKFGSPIEFRLYIYKNIYLAK